MSPWAAWCPIRVCRWPERDVPGFQATVRFDEGVRRCVDYLLAHPELQVADPEFDAWCDRVVEAQQARRLFL